MLLAIAKLPDAVHGTFQSIRLRANVEEIKRMVKLNLEVRACILENLLTSSSWPDTCA